MGWSRRGGSRSCRRAGLPSSERFHGPTVRDSARAHLGPGRIPSRTVRTRATSCSARLPSHGASGAPTALVALLITTGSHRDSTSSRVLLGPHDVVLVRLPTYPRHFGFRNVQAEMWVFGRGRRHRPRLLARRIAAPAWSRRAGCSTSCELPETRGNPQRLANARPPRGAERRDV